jgi:NitT/TauT family transport system permease protein
MPKLTVLLTQAAVGLLLIAVWQIASTYRWVDPRLLPAPSAVAATIEQLAGTPSFVGNAGDTLLRVAVAFAIGAPIALLTGFFLGESPVLGRSLEPLVQLVLAVPQSIFLPIFVLLLGLGFTEKVVFGITHVFFVVVINTMAAVRSVSRQQILAARSFGAGRLRIYRSIYLPATAPLVVTGLRYGLIFDIIGVLLAEMYASQSGIGLLLDRWGENLDVNKLMAATVIVAAGAIAVNEALRAWERRLARWQSATAPS